MENINNLDFISYIVDEDNNGLRIDKALAKPSIWSPSLWEAIKTSKRSSVQYCVKTLLTKAIS